MIGYGSSEIIKSRNRQIKRVEFPSLPITFAWVQNNSFSKWWYQPQSIYLTEIILRWLIDKNKYFNYYEIVLDKWYMIILSDKTINYVINELTKAKSFWVNFTRWSMEYCTEMKTTNTKLQEPRRNFIRMSLFGEKSELHELQHMLK